MIKFLYEKVTGQPWTTQRSMAAEFGPPPAARYPQLADYTDAELLAHGHRLLAAVEADRQARRDAVPPARFPDLVRS